MKQFYSIFVGGETGLLKGIDVEQRLWSNVTSLDQADRQKEIIQLCWNNNNEDELCFARRDQMLLIYDTSKNVITRSLNLSSGQGIFKGLCKVSSDYLTCTESGCLKLWSDTGENKLEISVGENVCCMRNNPQELHLVATGGKENELKLWNLQQQSPGSLFTAKNVRNDWLNLRVPVWITDLAFVPDSQQIITCTNYHQVRLYDPSTDVRRPVVDMTFGDCPITTMSLRSSALRQVFVGNAHGNMALLDLRAKGKVVQQYKGAEGGIRSVVCHPAQNVVASCGLDRYLRMHDMDSRQLLHKFYLKSRLNCLLFCSKSRPTEDSCASENSAPNPFPMSDEEENGTTDAGNDADDKIWSKMAPVRSSAKTSQSTISSKKKSTTKQCQSSTDCTVIKNIKKRRRKKKKVPTATLR